MAPAVTAAGMVFSEVDDLTHKLSSIKQLSLYMACQTERCALEAADEQRKLQAQIAYLEPLYSELYDEYLGSCELVDNLEDALQKKTVAMERAEKRSQNALVNAQNEATMLKGRLKSLENDLETIRTTTQSSAADLVAERNTAVSDLAAMQTEHQLLKERNTILETEIADAIKARDVAQSKLQGVQDEVTNLTKSLEALQKKHFQLENEFTSAKKTYTNEVSSWKSQFEESKSQHRSTLQDMETKHQATITDLETRLNRPSSPDKRILQLNESLKTAKAEITALQAALNKERKSREAAERGLSKARDEWETQHKVFETKLESLRTKYKAEREKNAAAAPASVVNPRKRTIGPVLDFEPSAKKPKTLPTAVTSEFSITPFLNRQQKVVASEDTTLASEAINDETKTNTLANSNPTAPVPAAGKPGRKIFTENTKDTISDAPRPLLVGANRKKKSSAAAPKLTPEPAPEDPILDPISESDDDNEEINEDSILDIVLPKNRVKASAATRKPSAKSTTTKPAKRPRKPLLSDSPEPEEAVLPPQPPARKPSQPKTKAVAKAAVKTKVKKKANAMEASFIGGIRPTLFDDEDGSGRIQLNLDDGPSQEARRLGKNAPLLAPINAFQREISPPKKRPGGLKMKFGGK
ncbi:hypothetical protein EX30DRAFT_339564 [Ascodesmis nigricans]|uniref:Uncharacterized protein n=1 Tax=Ascodesmis nigricans TaxID=341454 RepID=A0A4S2N2M3_9PEZI|nr:hypothetical protein EX30DRAFT_339564 [Ascodesmis nigricans]